MAKGKKASFLSVFGVVLVLYGIYSAATEEQGGFYLVILVPLGLVCMAVDKAGQVLSGDGPQGSGNQGEAGDAREALDASGDGLGGSAQEMEEKPDGQKAR